MFVNDFKMKEAKTVEELEKGLLKANEEKRAKDFAEKCEFKKEW